MGASDSKSIKYSPVKYYPECHENIKLFKDQINEQTVKLQNISECIMSIENSVAKLNKLNKELLAIRMKIKEDKYSSEIENITRMKKLITEISKHKSNIELKQNNIKYYWSNLLIDIDNGKYLHCFNFIKSWISKNIKMDDNIVKPKRSYKKQKKKPARKKKKSVKRTSNHRRRVYDPYRQPMPRYYY